MDNLAQNIVDINISTFKQLPVAIGIYSINGNIVYLNDKFSQLFGYNLSDIKTIQDWFDLAFPDKFLRKKAYKIWQNDVSQRVKTQNEKPRRESFIRCKNEIDKFIEIDFYIHKKNVVVLFKDITERKKFENELIKSEERFKTLFKNLPIPTYIWKKEDKDFILIDCNSVAASLDRGNMKDFLGNKLSQIYKKKPEIIKDVNECFRQKKLIRKETIYHLPAGPPKYLDVAYSFVPPNLVMVHTDDITDRVRAKVSLFESEEKYRTIIESTTDIIFTIDKTGKLLYINEQVYHQLGHVPSEGIGKSFLEYVPKSEIPKYLLKLKEIFLKKELKNFETVVYDINKNRVPVEINGRIIKQRNKTVALGSFKLIAERKKAEKALKDSELRFKTLSNLTFEGILIHRKGIAADFNSSFEKIFGYKRKELLGKNVIDLLVSKKYHPFVYKNIEKTNVPPYEAEGIRKDGTLFPIEVEARYIGQKRKVAAIRDITTRKKAEQSVIESDNRYRMIVNSISDGIAVIDRNGKFHSSNPTMCTMHGYRIDEMLRFRLSNIMHSDYSHILKKIKKVIESKDLFEEEAVTLHKNGVYVYVDIKARSFNYNNKKGILIIMSNISEQKKRELEILESITQTEEKERSWLAKELHDGIGPLLSATKIYSKTLQFAEDEQERDLILNKLNETIDEAITSAQEISNNISPHLLRNFGLKKAIESFYKKISLKNSMIFDFHSNIEKRLDEKIETTLYRVVVELINNTLKHTNASLITIILILNDNLLSLNYSDNGTGFDVSNTMSKGEGMGLFNIYSRIKSLNGTINMLSKKNKGFEVDIQIDIEQLIPRIIKS